MADDASFTATLGSGLVYLASASNREGCLFHTYLSGQPSRVSDPNAFCDAGDTDGRLCLFKSTTNTNTYTVKNRRGAQYGISLMTFTAPI